MLMPSCSLAVSAVVRILLYMMVSLAKRRMSEVMLVLMSFIYMKNSSGPRTDPCGTPEVIGTALDVLPSSTTCCVLPVRKPLIQARAFPWIPYLSSLYRSLLCASLSKALLKSTTTASIWTPECWLSWSSYTNSSSWVSQERPFLNPC